MPESRDRDRQNAAHAWGWRPGTRGHRLPALPWARDPKPCVCTHPAEQHLTLGESCRECLFCDQYVAAA